MADPPDHFYFTDLWFNLRLVGRKFGFTLFGHHSSHMCKFNSAIGLFEIFNKDSIN